MTRGMLGSREGTLLWTQRMKRMAREGMGQDRRQNPTGRLVVLRQKGKGRHWHASSGSAKGTEAPLKREFMGDRLAEPEGAPEQQAGVGALGRARPHRGLGTAWGL